MSKIKREHKKAVHATISHESYNILEEFEKNFSSKSAVVDAAIKSLKKSNHPYLEEKNKIWCRA
ncbi:hypothetical protein LCGC14_0532700 [marine sediment metagenome]|uniref:CopG family transcriptional regulator n=1 Tax=marine sediment metagenome TaxID=412755 RepID=A0A0F9UGJ9_9ZZZZ